MSYSPFLSLDRENNYDHPVKYIDNNFNGRLFISPKSLQPDTFYQQENNIQRININPNETTNMRSYDLFYGASQIQPLSSNIITNQLEPNKLTNTYFSKNNVDYIQHKIIEKIKLEFHKDITRQSDTQIQIIMRSIYFQFSKNNWSSLQMQLNELNKLVIDECVNIIKPNILQYEGYVRYVSNPITIMPLPENNSNKGRNTFSLFV